MTEQPTLTINGDPRQPRSWFVGIHKLPPDVIGSLVACPESDRLLQAMLRVRVIGPGVPEGAADDLPDVAGRYYILEDGVRFIPRFPFEPGVRFRATFEPRQIGLPQCRESLACEFSIPREIRGPRARVKQVFPTSDALPENLLRFYACFSEPMQRGWAEKHIMLLDAAGRPVPDVLYRPPLELWDRSMTCLTILLDPGRLKRGVGPNRALGPPLEEGRQYTLAIDSGMLDMSGRPLRTSFRKTFHVLAAVREGIAVEQWSIRLPRPKSRESLDLGFPRPMDWALLWHTVSVASEGGQPIEGHISIDQCERRWSFTPKSFWSPGSYCFCVESSLEDVCGNSLLGPFDRPLRSTGGRGCKTARWSRPLLIA
jgi:hypothetical protein